MKRAYVDIPMGQIHYLVEGNGEPILLLHQTPLSSNEYAEMMPILGKKYRAIAMDTPGYGKSDPPPRKYRIEDYAGCVIDFLDALGISKACIVGTHTGASIAVELAVSWPDRVDGLVLNGCPHYEPEVRKARLTDPKYHPMEIREDGSHLMKPWKVARDWSPRLRPESWHKWVVDYLVAGAYAESAHQALFRHDVEPLLPLIKSPTLLISGTEDVFYHRLEPTKRLIRHCKTKIIEGGGIVIGYERAEEFGKAILEFLVDPET